jgi:hypothetical protein
LCLLLAWGAIPVRAATLTVTTTADSGAGSLREALTNAVNGDTITFTISGTIQLLTNLPTITITNLTINGNSATLSGNNNIRMFTIASGASVTINTLTMTTGDCSGNCPLLGNDGGGIYNAGRLTLSHSTLSGNLASGGSGGGIYNDGGTVTISNSTLSGNSANAASGGGIYSDGGTVTVSDSTFSGNSADDGGGIANNLSSITIRSTTLSNNSASSTGGSISNGGLMTIASSTFSSNSANSVTGGGGSIFNTGNLTISSSTFSSNSAGSGGVFSNNSGTVTISRSTFSSNSAISGGGFSNNSGMVTITNSTFSSNSADDGGGFSNDSGTVTITNSTFSSNSTSGNNNGGGGFLNLNGIVTITNSTLSGNSGNGGFGGGGFGNDGGTVTLTNSTLSGNSSSGGFGGGGIFNAGNLTITNSTLSSNSADAGGGIFNIDTLTLTHSTLSGNSAISGGGGVYNAGTLTLKNTLIGKGASGPNCGGTISSNGATYNLADDASCGADVKQAASLGLGVLGANGGLTQTIPLLASSPAIDAANSANCPTTDQRGATRPSGAHCDIGAFEYQQAMPSHIPDPALCSLTGFASSTQVAIALPNGNNGLNVCYSLLTDPAQVGIMQPFTLAAEVYSFDASGSVTTGVPVQVCLQGAGTLLYRDASGQPRTTVSLPSFSENGFTCGIIPHAGTVILIPGAPAPSATTPLSACRVTTTHILNLRAAPDATSAVLDLVPYQTALSASARSGAWLQVVYGAQQGWLSAAYLSLDGACG